MNCWGPSARVRNTSQLQYIRYHQKVAKVVNLAKAVNVAKVVEVVNVAKVVKVAKAVKAVKVAKVVKVDVSLLGNSRVITRELQNDVDCYNYHGNPLNFPWEIATETFSHPNPCENCFNLEFRDICFFTEPHQAGRTNNSHSNSIRKKHRSK